MEMRPLLLDDEDKKIFENEVRPNIEIAETRLDEELYLYDDDDNENVVFENYFRL